MSETASLSQRATDGATRDASRAFTLFAFLWAISIIVHNHMRSEWARTPTEFAMSVLAFVVLFRPGSLPVFLALLASQVLNLFHWLPQISTHSIVALFAAAIVLSVWVRRMVLSRRLSVSKTGIFCDAAPLLRMLILILYFWTGFHKLNTDFFNPEVSCGSMRYLNLQQTSLSFLPSGTLPQYVVIYSTVALEMLLPVLLLFVRTRLAGLAVAALLHVTFAFVEHVSFTALMLALLSLFLPANFMSLHREWKKQIPASIRRIPASFWRAALLVCFLIAIHLISGNRWAGLTPAKTNTGDWTGPFVYLWIAFYVILIILFLMVLRTGRPFLPPAATLLKPPGYLLLLYPLFFFANGLNPYLGLNTENSFALYSNLRTELGASNHLLIRKPLQLSPCQTDYVTVLSASSTLRQNVRLPAYDSICNLRLRISEAALRARPGEKLRIVYIRNGLKQVVEDAFHHPELSRRYPYLLRKFMRLKPVPRTGKFLCRH